MYLYIPILNKKINLHDGEELYSFIKMVKYKAYKCGVLSLRAKYGLETEMLESESMYYSIIDFDASIKEEIDKGRTFANITLNWLRLPYTLSKNLYYKSVLSIYRKKFNKYLDERDYINQTRRKESIESDILSIGL